MAGPYRLLVVDLDDTVLGRGRSVEPVLEDRFGLLARLGVGFTIATGRLYPSVVPYAHQLGVSLPVVASSGAEIRDPKSGRVVRRLAVPPQVVAVALDAASCQGVTRYLVLGDDLVTDGPADEEASRYAALLGVPLRSCPDLVSGAAARADEVLAVLLRGSDKHIDRLEENCRRILDGSARTIRAFPHLLEILNPRASKGDALSLLASMLGVPLSQVVAVGDGPGDLDMIRAAGLGAFVSNAAPWLKEQADYVTAGPGPEGVAEVIDRFFLGRAGE